LGARARADKSAVGAINRPLQLVHTPILGLYTVLRCISHDTIDFYCCQGCVWTRSPSIRGKLGNKRSWASTRTRWASTRHRPYYGRLRTLGRASAPPPGEPHHRASTRHRPYYGRRSRLVSASIVGAIHALSPGNTETLFTRVGRPIMYFNYVLCGYQNILKGR
jgi:hypothetical protein